MDSLACTHLYLAYESPVEPRWLTPRGLAIAPLGLILAGLMAFPASAEPVCWTIDCQAPVETDLSESEVAVLQDHLKALGYFPVEVRSTGYYGEITRESVGEFQQASGLPVDGIADATTLAQIDGAIAALESPPKMETPQLIDTVELQSRLKTLGYFPERVRATGYYGAITEESVRKFQRAYGLPANGIAGASTVLKLEEVTQYGISASRGGTMRRFPETHVSAPKPSRIAAPKPSRAAARKPPEPSAPTALRPGDVGAAVLEVKRRLQQYGYTAGIGNLYDTQMVIAVKRFQEDKGLEADGLVGSQTEQLLYAVDRGLPSLREGDRGHLVQLVQYQLNLIPTGEFDAVTAATVKDFQQKSGLQATGVVDGITHKALGTHLARLSLRSMR